MVDSINLDDIEVLILAGGLGTRLKEAISNLPKPMAPIGEMPFLEVLIRNIKKQGLKNFCLLTSYKSEIIEKHFNLGDNLKVNIRYSVQTAPDGTAKAIREGISSSNKGQFLILNGDTFFDIPLVKMLENNHEMTIATLKVQDLSRYGSVEISSDQYVTAFEEKKGSKKSGYINGGIYFCTKELLKEFSDKEASLEKETLPRLAQNNKLKALSFDSYFIDIGIPEDYKKAQKELSKYL